jgi:phosphocarrier protein
MPVNGKNFGRETAMREFQYTIKDELGIHARPAGLLVKDCSKFSSQIILRSGDKEADGKKIFTLLSLVAKYGDTIHVIINGDDEDQAFMVIKTFFCNNL